MGGTDGNNIESIDKRKKAPAEDKKFDIHSIAPIPPKEETAGFFRNADGTVTIVRIQGDK